MNGRFLKTLIELPNYRISFN